MNKEKITGIYKITSPTGKVYVGQSVDIYSRWKQHKSMSKLNCDYKLYNSLKKNGFDNHIFEIIHICKREELNYFEIFYGKLFNVTDRICGLNTRDCGGSKGKFNEETKKKMSEVAKKRFINPENNPFYKKHHTKETKKLLSEINVGKSRNEEAILKAVKKNTGKKRTDEFKINRSGDKNPNYGKKMSEKVKSALILANTGLKRSDKFKDNLSKRMIGENNPMYNVRLTGYKNPFYGKKHTPESILKRNETRIRNKKAKEEIIRQEKALIIF